MKAIILAAGFATRLYPLTLNKPKPLLEISNKPIIEHIIEKIEEIKEINKIIIVSNDKFYNNFVWWLNNAEKKFTIPIEIINDGVVSIDNKLGAIGDLYLAIENNKIDEDLLVISGDNMSKYSLKPFYEIFKKENKDLSIFYDVLKINDAKRFGIALVTNNLIQDFQEKPENPLSTLASTSTYFYKKETLELIRKFNREEKNKDQPGLLLQYLFKKVPIYAAITKEKWIDIGTIEALEEAKEFFT